MNSGREPRKARLRKEPEFRSSAAKLPSAEPFRRATEGDHLFAVRLDSGRRSDRVRLLQQTQGNAYVQRLLHPSAATIQREEVAPQASSTVPGLSQDVVTQIASRLTDNRQGALDTLAAALVKRGDIDLSFLAGGTMTYVQDKAGMAPNHFGHTSLTAGTGIPRPSKVEIGPDAFQSVSNLYATVMHEWKHVLQFRKPELISDAMAEFEAFLSEVQNLDQTGLWRNPEYMNRIANLLHGNWSRLSETEKAALRSDYEAAQEILHAKRKQASQEYRERVKVGNKK